MLSALNTVGGYTEWRGYTKQQLTACKKTMYVIILTTNSDFFITHISFIQIYIIYLGILTTY